MFVVYENKTYYTYNIFSILYFEDFKIRHETKKAQWETDGQMEVPNKYKDAALLII